MVTTAVGSYIFFGVYGPRKKENHTRSFKQHECEYIISTWKQKEIANNPIDRLSIDSQTTLQMTEKSTDKSDFGSLLQWMSVICGWASVLSYPVCPCGYLNCPVVKKSSLQYRATSAFCF